MHFNDEVSCRWSWSWYPIIGLPGPSAWYFNHGVSYHTCMTYSVICHTTQTSPGIQLFDYQDIQSSIMPMVLVSNRGTIRTIGLVLQRWRTRPMVLVSNRWTIRTIGLVLQRWSTRLMVLVSNRWTIRTIGLVLQLGRWSWYPTR